MSELVWYVYQQSQQLGPFASDQMVQMYHSKMIAHDAYLFKVGWKDWRAVEEAVEDLGIVGAATPASDSRRAGAPRATIRGRVIVHNNGHLIIGAGVNISQSGIFVETSDQIFTVSERLKLSVRCDGIAKPFNVVAQVIRFNTDPRFPVGYGLKFEQLEPGVQEEIQRLVDEANRGRNPHDQVGTGPV